MRYSAEHKAATRRRIVAAATGAFKEAGAEATSLPEIMGRAGLTVGGFYRHFESKDELFAAVAEASLEHTAALLRAAPKDLEGTAWQGWAADRYLTLGHCARRAEGCPLPALTAEVARHGEAAREGFGRGLQSLVDEIAERLPPADDGAAREQAWGFLASLVGGLLLARGVADPAQAEEILAACRRAAATAPRQETPRP